MVLEIDELNNQTIYCRLQNLLAVVLKKHPTVDLTRISMTADKISGIYYEVERL